MKHLKNSRMLFIVFAALSSAFAVTASAKNVPPQKNIFAERPLVHVLMPRPAFDFT